MSELTPEVRAKLSELLAAATPFGADETGMTAEQSIANAKFLLAIWEAAEALLDAAERAEKAESELRKIEATIGRAECVERNGRDLDDWLCQVLQVLVGDASNAKYAVDMAMSLRSQLSEKESELVKLREALERIAGTPRCTGGGIDEDEHGKLPAEVTALHRKLHAMACKRCIAAAALKESEPPKCLKESEVRK